MAVASEVPRSRKRKWWVWPAVVVPVLCACLGLAVWLRASPDHVPTAAPASSRPMPPPGPPAFVFGPVTWTTQPGLTEFKGTVTNQSAETRRGPSVRVVLYDGAGRVVGEAHGYTNLPDPLPAGRPDPSWEWLKPHETRQFTAHAGPIAGAVRYIVELDSD